jgi:hypothetical protein
MFLSLINIIYLIINQHKIPKFSVKMVNKWEKVAFLPLHILHNFISYGILTK